MLRAPQLSRRKRRWAQPLGRGCPPSPAETSDVPSPGVKGCRCQDIWEPLRSLARTQPVFCFSSFVRGSRGGASFSDYPSILFGKFLPERAATFHIQCRNKTRHTKTPGPLGVERELCSLVFGALVIPKLKESHGKKKCL